MVRPGTDTIKYWHWMLFQHLLFPSHLYILDSKISFTMAGICIFIIQAEGGYGTVEASCLSLVQSSPSVSN